MILSYKEHAFMKDLLNKIEGLLKEKGAEVTSFYEAVANPTMDGVRAGVEVARKEKQRARKKAFGDKALDKKGQKKRNFQRR